MIIYLNNCLNSGAFLGTLSTFLARSKLASTFVLVFRNMSLIGELCSLPVNSFNESKPYIMCRKII